MAGSAFNLSESFSAALADGWVTGVFAYVDGIVPATVAFLAIGFEYFDVKWLWMVSVHRAVEWQDLNLRNNEEPRQVLRMPLQ